MTQKKSNSDTEVEPCQEYPLGPDLLVMLPPRNKLFDNISNSGSFVSELSEPFSDVVFLPEAEKEIKNGELASENEDLCSVLSFSPHFKATLMDVKRQRLLKNPEIPTVEGMMSETLDQIQNGAQVPISHKIPVSVQNRIVGLLNDKTYNFSSDSSKEASEESEDEAEKESLKKKPQIKKPISYFDPRKNWEDLKDDVLAGGKKSIITQVKKLTRREKRKITGTSKRVIKIEDDAYETMSGYWRLISAVDEFKISPPYYDAYNQKQPHWLQTKPIPYAVYEESRAKCLDWLRKHFDRY